MPRGYWIGHVDVTDPEGYARYIRANADAFTKFGGKFLVRGGAFEAVEGEARSRHVVIEFPSYQDALACYQSPEYAAALPERLAAAMSEVVVVEGYDAPEPKRTSAIGRRFPTAVPEIPVANLDAALEYYESRLGFTVDWGRGGGGIAGISQGRSRIFLTDNTIREYFRTEPPVVIWLNLDSKDDVNALHERWSSSGAKILHPPESKSWSRLHEFVTSDIDGNFIRAFYNF